MSFREKISHRFTEKAEKKKRYLEETAKLTVFKENIKDENQLIEEKGSQATRYPIVEIEICPQKVICSDCGGETLEGLEYCDKCGGEVFN